MEKADLHNTKRAFVRALERMDALKIPKRDKVIIYKFKDYCLSHNVGQAKLIRYFTDLKRYILLLKKPIEKATKDDLIRVLADLNQTDLSEESKKAFKICVKRLYKIVYGIEGKNKYPEIVEWISTSVPQRHKKLPEELLTEKEVQCIVKCCSWLRDKALIATLAESGCRVSEVGLMKIKHVSFEKYGARLTVNGKTGMRKILVVNSTPYLQEWINQHPKNDNPDAYLWHNTQKNEYLSYVQIGRILKTASEKAGIKKRVHLHLLRHTRATALASIMTDAPMKHYFGWTQGSRMASVYIHMSGKDTDASILAANGIKIEQEVEESKLKPKRCLKCKTNNEATNRFCKICGLILDKEEAEKSIKEDAERYQFDDIMNKVVKDPKIQRMLLEKIMVLKK